MGVGVAQAAARNQYLFLKISDSKHSPIENSAQTLTFA